MRHGNVNHSFGVPKERQERNQKRYGNLYNSRLQNSRTI